MGRRGVVEEEAAYVLHRRPYRETSLLVDLFARGAGRIRAVARGGRRTPAAGQPFVQLAVAWSGRSSLKTLTRAEPMVPLAPLPAGRELYLGLYLNELLLRLLPEADPHPRLYEHYRAVLAALPGGVHPEPLLRRFELALLAELGYGFELECTAGGQPLAGEGCYRFVPGVGLVAAAAGSGGDLLQGRHLLAMAAEDYRDPEVCRCAKRLTRTALAEHLGPRPLRSRELFRKAVPGRRRPA
ncbi:MAG: DNA repair protein RecO [Pseudomonadota bacterium]